MSELTPEQEAARPTHIVIDLGNGEGVLQRTRLQSATETPLSPAERAILLLHERHAAAEAQRDKLQAFKDFVHGRLDAAGVPKEFPDGPHSREGCRIGDRLDWLAAKREQGWTALEITKEMRDAVLDEKEDELSRLRQRVADLTAGLREMTANCGCGEDMEPCANCGRAARLLAEDRP